MSVMLASMSPHAFEGALAFLVGHWLVSLGALASIGFGTLTVTAEKRSSRTLYAVSVVGIAWILLGLNVTMLN